MTNAILELSSNLKHWCTWEWKWDYKSSKWKKPPMSHEGKPLSVSEPNKWSSYDQIKDFEHKGFLLTEDDPHTVIDLDDCIHDGEIYPWAEKILYEIGSYTEISPSGTGIKIFTYGVKPANSLSKFEIDGHTVEVYDRNRYVTFTDEMYGYFFNFTSGQDWIDENVPVRESILESTKPNSTQSIDLTDEEIVSKLSSFAYGARFMKLYGGDIKGYLSHSEADLALCWFLAFMTKDPKQIDRIFLGSGLYRGKWDKEHYKNLTINKALESNPGTYSNKIPSDENDLNYLYEYLYTADWNNDTDFLIFKAILDNARDRGFNKEQDDILTFASVREIRLREHLSTNQISARLRAMNESDHPISIIQKGDVMGASRFLLKGGAVIVHSVDNPPVYTSVRLAHSLGYQPLSPKNRRALNLVLAYPKMTVDELFNRMGATCSKKNFKRNTIKALEGKGSNLIPYIKIDGMNFINTEDEIEQIIFQNEDTIKREEVKRDIKRDREMHIDKNLHMRIQEYMETTASLTKV